jgi:hypothetical protein
MLSVRLSRARVGARMRGGGVSPSFLRRRFRYIMKAKNWGDPRAPAGRVLAPARDSGIA